jgi:alpha-glucuronidase
MLMEIDTEEARKQFHDFVKQIAVRSKKKFTTIYRRKIDALLFKLIAVTPRHTGAAAGEATGTPMPPSHPAFGMTIGNDEGDSGWQLREVTEGKHTVWVIVNPMWLPYLHYLEYGTIRIPAQGFLRSTWEEFKIEQGV